jgi:hypothetical protein
MPSMFMLRMGSYLRELVVSAPLAVPKCQFFQGLDDNVAFMFLYVSLKLFAS